MFIADAHCDTLYAMGINRLTHPCVTAAALQKGQVGLETFAMFAGGKEDPGSFSQRADAMLSCVDKLGVPILRGKLPNQKPTAPTGVLSIEGGELLQGSLEKLAAFATLGVRMIALTWNYENEIGYPALSGSHKGLKPFGRELLHRMGELGIVADVSHLNDQGIEDVLAHSHLPVAASHSNLREITNVPRNLPRALASGIIQTGGFIGLNFYSNFLAKDRPAEIDDVLRHLDGLMALGGESTVGFGSDFDGIESWPDGLAGPADLPALLSRIEQQGYPLPVVQAIAGENLWQLYQKAQRTA